MLDTLQLVTPIPANSWKWDTYEVHFYMKWALMGRNHLQDWEFDDIELYLKDTGCKNTNCNDLA
jgi:hypothetical protein